MQAKIDHLVGCGWFWAWAVVGLGMAFGFISLGLFAWVPTLFLALPMAVSPRIRQSAFGVFTGAGALCLLVAWVQRRGPGTVCWEKADSSGCNQYLDPRPWLAVGILLVVAGLFGHAVRSRRDG